MFLQNIVAQWETPESEMVAYRSFTPFFPLMAENQEYSVQLWAVWAIHHVCSKNRKYIMESVLVCRALLGRS